MAESRRSLTVNMLGLAYWGKVMRAGIVAFLSLASVNGLLAQERPPIIDMHLHARVTMARTADGTPRARMCLPAPCVEHPAVASDDEDVLRLTLEAMDRSDARGAYRNAGQTPCVDRDRGADRGTRAPSNRAMLDTPR